MIKDLKVSLLKSFMMPPNTHMHIFTCMVTKERGEEEGKMSAMDRLGCAEIG